MKMGKLISSLMVVTMITSVFAGSASARGQDRFNQSTKRIVLDYDDEHYRGGIRGNGEAETLYLKRKIKEEYPNMDLRRFKIKMAKLVAKTKHGQGKAYLVVGQDQSERKQVGGNPSDFFSYDADTFYRVRFQNPAYSSQGKWQIKLRGNFIVRKVVLRLEKIVTTKRIVLDYYDEHYRGGFRGNGEAETLYLKRKIKEEYPNMNLRRFKIKMAQLVAKTKHGQGKAYLVVGQDQSMSKRVNGNPDDFFSYESYTFDRVPFKNPSSSSIGRWQIKLRGNFIVRKVILQLQKI